MSRFSKFRRKIFGLILGIGLGAGISVTTSKSALAFGGGGLSAEELFEKFLKRAGNVLMRFLSNRFVTNLDNTLDELSESTDDDNKSSKAELAKSIASSSDSHTKALSELSQLSLKREAYIPNNACVQHEVASANHRIYKVSAEFNDALNRRNQQHLLAEGTSRGKQQNHRHAFLKSLVDGNDIKLKQLHLLFESASFSDPIRAEKEIAALVANIRTPINESGNVTSKSINVKRSGTAAQAELVVNALNFLLSQRLKSSTLPQGILDSLSNELQTYYRYKKLSSIELLEAEVLSTTQNSKFYDELSRLPSSTSAMVMFTQITATSNKLHHELLKTEDHLNLLLSVQSILDESMSKRD